MKPTIITIFYLILSLFPTSAQATGLTLTMVNVGQAECIVIVVGQDAMIVDAGYVKSWDKIESVIDELDIDSFQYFILTHPHADHIGCATKILDTYDVNTVMLSPISHDSATYKNLELFLSTEDINFEYPQVGQQYTLGTAKITIYGPHPVSYQELNDWSIVMMIEYADRRILLTGDIETEAENDLLAFSSQYPLNADILKVAHHGSNTSSSYDFLSAVSPQYAVISCSSNGDEEYPHIETAMNLYDCGIEDIFLTSTSGNITVTINPSGELAIISEY